AVVRKIGQIQTELGSVGAVVFDGIADLLDRAGLDASVMTSIEEQEKRIRASSKAAKELEESRSHDLEKEILHAGRILDQSRKALEFDPKLLRDALDVGLAWAGATPLVAAASPKEEPALKAYRLPELGEGWAATLDSARPAQRREEKVWEWRK